MTRTRIDVDTLLQRIVEKLSREDETFIAEIASKVLPFKVEFDEDSDEFLIEDSDEFLIEEMA